MSAAAGDVTAGTSANNLSESPRRVRFEVEDEERDYDVDTSEDFTYDCAIRKERKYFLLTLKILFVVVFGIFKVILGTWTTVDGNRAQVLAKNGQFGLGAVFLIAAGVSSLLCSAWLLRTLVFSGDVKKATSSQINTVMFILLYISVFDVIAAIMFSHFTHKDFESDVKSGLNETLSERYSSWNSKGSAYKAEWDRLQTDNLCCGALNFTDWFGSKWAEGIPRKDNESIVPVSCRHRFSSSGTCHAVRVAPRRRHRDYIALIDFEIVTWCNVDDAVYIHADPCSQVYFLLLLNALKSAMWTTIALLAMDFALIAGLAKISRSLPRRQQVHIT
ncbi:CD151 antigen-like [Clavelina lepadiformis]|uniref:CD151 antigen-like n=1 Tax=Clavelina lepadiformis TaxID=159417 RepID=UPI00404311F2